MTLRPEVIQRLLLAKSILAPYRFAPWGEPDAHTIAVQVLASHDAADLVFAALADHQGKLTNASKDAPSMVKCLDLIKVKGKGAEKPITYFRDLNEVRDSLKHIGNLPNTKQWGRVGRETYEKLSATCQTCIGLSFDEIDESALLRSDEVRTYFSLARNAVESGEYRKALEEIGKALSILLDANTALNDVSVGSAKAEDAIKLSGFGVPANDFLRLQEFLPQVFRFGDEPFRITWKQSEFGHPGNWREDVARFCVDAFLNIAPKIQDAKWIPGAIELWHFYDYKVTANEDNVEVWEEVHSPMGISASVATKHKVGQLQKGDSKRFSAIHQSLVSDWTDEVTNEFFKIVKLPADSAYSALFLGAMRFVLFEKVTITCVPKQWRLEQVPDLTEIPWRPDGESTEEQP